MTAVLSSPPLIALNYKYGLCGHSGLELAKRDLPDEGRESTQQDVGDDPG